MDWFKFLTALLPAVIVLLVLTASALFAHTVLPILVPIAITLAIILAAAWWLGR